MNKVYKTSEAPRASSKAWRETNREEINAKARAKYQTIRESELARNKAWREVPANKESVIARKKVWHAAKYASDIPYKLSKLVTHAHLRATGKRIGKQGFLGCTLEEYKEYLESKFQQGMTWDNHTVDGWHIDHILPLNESGTTLTEEEKIKRLHYTNTQPLWAEDNMKKGNKLEEDNDV